MEERLRTVLRGLYVVGFLLGAGAAALALMSLPPFDFAPPTPLCVTEVELLALVFVGSVVLMEPLRSALETHASRWSRLMGREVRLSAAAKMVAFALVVVGCFEFAFWSIADVLGGYNGYGFSFAHYPILQLLYSDFIGLIPFISSQDKGTQGSFFFALAFVGLVALRSSSGLGSALKDSLTLFVAPCLVVFELAIWFHAPLDMTWHVTDYLWMGGTADGGYRAKDLGGAYFFSNWLVLFVSLFLVASRVPWLSLPSKILWRHKARFLGAYR